MLLQNIFFYSAPPIVNEKTKINSEMHSYPTSGSAPLRSFESRLSTNHFDRYPPSSMSSLTDLSRSGFQPYRSEDR